MASTIFVARLFWRSQYRPNNIAVTAKMKSKAHGQLIPRLLQHQQHVYWLITLRILADKKGQEGSDDLGGNAY